MINVRVAPKKSDHPTFNKGAKLAYTFDGKEGLILKLVRRKIYKFNVDTVGHPFYFTTDSMGSHGNNESLMGNEPVTDKGITTFYVRSDLPKKFYYQCQIHPNMGGDVEIIDNSN